MRVQLTVSAGPLTGRIFTFAGHDVFLVGRSANAHCRLPEDDPYFSRIHFLIEVNPPKCRLMDMDSRNGTYVNTRRVTSTDLRHGDVIKAGHTVMQLQLISDADDRPADRASPIDSPVTLADMSMSALAPGQSKLRPQTPLVPPPPPPRPATIPAVPVKFIPPPPAENLEVSPSAEELPSMAFGPDVDPKRAQVPGYSLIRELGRGTMGVVFLGQRNDDGTRVAIKTILPSEVDNVSTMSRFLREAEILGQLDHPNIVKFQETREHGGRLNFVMEYVPGVDVASVLRERPRMEPKTAIRLVIQVLDALAHAHSRSFVHRDIKPANVLLMELPDGRRQVKLADFGLARVYRASRLSGLTISGDLGGTPAYMPPEQITHYSSVQPAADQYSSAAMLYHLLTGKWIFDLPPMPAGLLTILTKEPIPLRQRRPDLPEGLEECIKKALSKKPEDRYADVVEFRKALVPFAK